MLFPQLLHGQGKCFTWLLKSSLAPSVPASGVGLWLAWTNQHVLGTAAAGAFEQWSSLLHLNTHFLLQSQVFNSEGRFHAVGCWSHQRRRVYPEPQALGAGTVTAGSAGTQCQGGLSLSALQVAGGRGHLCLFSRKHVGLCQSWGQFCVLALVSVLTFSASQPQQNPTMFHWQVEKESHGTTPWEMCPWSSDSCQSVNSQPLGAMSFLFSRLWSI